MQGATSGGDGRIKRNRSRFPHRSQFINNKRRIFKKIILIALVYFRLDRWGRAKSTTETQVISEIYYDWAARKMGN